MLEMRERIEEEHRKQKVIKAAVRRVQKVSSTLYADYLNGFTDDYKMNYIDVLNLSIAAIITRKGWLEELIVQTDMMETLYAKYPEEFYRGRLEAYKFLLDIAENKEDNDG